MLDENLPTFVLKSSSDKPKQNLTFLYSQYGADFEPSYSLRHPDPDQHTSKNRYAAALYDAYNPDVLFAEVLLIPEWNQPSVNADSRQIGGVPPPPEPVLPAEFVIQLYNPDQQVAVRHKPASWNSAATWDFEVPQQTFRAPSTSALDRGQHDPAASEITPKIGLKWKKDSKLSKDLGCFLSGKSTNPDGSRRKHKEPDITVAIFKGLKEVTLYEPNLQRVEIEDIKGLEVVLLLGAVVIRDVYFGSLKETFNINEGSRKASGTRPVLTTDLSSSRLSPTTSPIRDPRVPPTDPRSQWELDAETARLRRQAAEEERQRLRREEAAEMETRRMLEAEDRDQRRIQAQVDQETERLKRLYGQEDSSARPNVPPRQQRYPSDPSQSAYAQNVGSQNPYSFGGPSPPLGYMTSGPAQSSSLLAPQQRLKQKSSIFSFRRQKSEDGPSRLQRTRSIGSETSYNH